MPNSSARRADSEPQPTENRTLTGPASTPDGELSIGRLRGDLEFSADATAAAAMSAYMRDQFPFLGLKARDRRDAAKWFVKNARHAAVSDIWDAADALWAEPEREFQYVGSDMLRRWAGRFGPEDIGRVETLIVTKSWWDTVDTLAADTVGTMVANHPPLVEVMDRWVEHENLWLIRTAIIHQLKRRDTIDAERLFAYADRQAAHTDFFIRKAIGWALRQHGRTDPDAVRAFVAERTATLSGLTKREALKHLS